MGSWKAFAFCSEEYKNKKILRKDMKLPDITGCCFENGPWRETDGGVGTARVELGHKLGGHCSGLGESSVMHQK